MMASWTLGPLVVTSPVLLAGVFAAGIPVVLHLLHRIRAPEMPFATLRFLRVSMQKTARRRRVHHWLLLVLRSALLALLAVALAQPVIRLTSSIAPGSRTAAAIVLDNSMSMSAEDGEQTRWQRARSFARQILTGPGHPAEVVVAFTNGRAAGRPPRLMTDIGEALRIVEETSVGIGRARIDAVVSAAVAALRKSALPNRCLYLITDGQALSFRASKAIRAALGGTDWPVFVLDCSRTDPVNVAVVDLSIGGYGRVVGVRLTFRATVRNSSPMARTVRVGFETDGQHLAALDQDVVLSPAGQARCEQTVTFEHTYTRPGIHLGRVFIEHRAFGQPLPPDQIVMDDSRYFALQVAPTVNALIVTGRSSETPVLDPALYVRTALAVAPPVTAAVCTIDALDASRLASQHAVFCLDVPRFSAQQDDLLRRFVARGGHLALFCGPQVDAASYNAVLGRRDPGTGSLLPARLVEPLGDPTDRARAEPLVRLQRDDPLFAGLYDEPSWMARVLVFRHFRVEGGQNPPGALAWLGSGDPLMVGRPYGKGRVLLVTTSGDTAWTNLPVQPLFLPMLLRFAVSSAALGSGRDDIYLPGSRVTLRFGGSEPVPIDVTHPIDASGRRVTDRIVTQPGPEGNEATFAWTFAAGQYEWRVADDSGRSGAFVVNPDPDESDLAPADDATVAEAFAGRYFAKAATLEELRDHLRTAERGRPWWDYLLAVILAMVTLEALVANRYRPSQAVRPAGPTATTAS